MSARKYRTHPLRMLFGSRKMTERDGMNLLHEGPELFISDNCVTVDDIAPCDVRAVLVRAKALHFLPTPLDVAP